MAALNIALEDLKPTADQLNKAEQRTNWLHRAHALKLHVQKLLALVAEKREMYGPVSKDFALKCK